MQVFNKYEAATFYAIEEVIAFSEMFRGLISKHPECLITDLESLVCYEIHGTACEERLLKGLRVRGAEKKVAPAPRKKVKNVGV
jgi:hypothetical protein